MLYAKLQAKGKANYGWDAPGVMLGLLSIGSALVAVGVVLAMLQPFAFSGTVGAVLIVAGAIPLTLGLAMLQYGIFGKLRTRDAILGLVAWRGDEAVLDVGAGAGMLMIGAAKRLTRGGRAVGVDVWAAKDLSGNSAEATWRNIALEGVAACAEVRTEDARRLSFPDATFDVALSLLCLHNIEPKADRGLACREIARVLKPGGRVVIGDYVPTHSYAQALREAGLDVKRTSPPFGIAGALMWLLVADKPAKSIKR